MTKTKIFIVRGEDSGCPESVILGVYPTESLAMVRVHEQEDNFEFVWFDVVETGTNGVDCMLYNR